MAGVAIALSVLGLALITAGSDASASFGDSLALAQHAERLGYRRFEPRQAVQAVAGRGVVVPVWILGSSVFGSRLAATLGSPYAFASHFAPARTRHAISLYRAEFEPSRRSAHGRTRCSGSTCSPR